MATSHIHADIGHIRADNSSSGSHCEQDEDSSSVVVGILMGIFGSILINVGQNLQATAMQSSPEVQAKPHISQTWRVGMGTFATGSLLNFAAFTFASASVLVPIEAIQFVVNVAWSKHVNKKPVSTRMVRGVVLVILGTICCVVFGSTDTRCFTIADLEAFWTRPLWWGWLIGSLSAAFVAFSVHTAHSRALAQGSPRPNHEIVLPVTFAVSSALLGGANMIVHSKAVAELMELQVQMIEPIPLRTWYFYLELFLLITMGFFWLYRMNQSLGLYDPLFIIPLLQSSYILFGVVAGGIYFEEFAGLHNGPAGYAGWPLFILGMLAVLSGLALIAPTRRERERVASKCRIDGQSIASPARPWASARSEDALYPACDADISVQISGLPSAISPAAAPSSRGVLPPASSSTPATGSTSSRATPALSSRMSCSANTTPAEISVQLTEEDGRTPRDSALIMEDLYGEPEEEAGGGEPLARSGPAAPVPRRPPSRAGRLSTSGKNIKEAIVAVASKGASMRHEDDEEHKPLSPPSDPHSDTPGSDLT